MGCGCGKKFTRPASSGARVSAPAANINTASSRTSVATNTIRSAPTPTFKTGRTGIVRGRV